MSKTLSEARIASLLKKADKYPEQLTKKEIEQLTYIKARFDHMLKEDIDHSKLSKEEKEKVNSYLEKGIKKEA